MVMIFMYYKEEGMKAFKYLAAILEMTFKKS